jgi:hypothetical protein
MWEQLEQLCCLSIVIDDEKVSGSKQGGKKPKEEEMLSHGFVARNEELILLVAWFSC